MDQAQAQLLPTVLVLASGRGARFTASGGVGHKLQADLAGLDPFRFRIAPIDDGRAVDCHEDAVALSEDFDVVPIVLFADLLRRPGIDRQTGAAIEIVHAPTGREHDEMARESIFRAVFFRVLADIRLHLSPKANAGMHFGLHELGG